MESSKKIASGSSSSSTSSFVDLFGPKDSPMPSSSAGHFSSVFGPSTTGLGRDYSHSGFSKPSRNQNSASLSEHASTNYETQDYKTPKGSGKSGSVHSKDSSNSYQSETADPCYFNSSIYYGGQQVYSPSNQPINTHNALKKDGGDDNSDGSNLNSASRGNWWQGSLYY